MRDRRRTAAMVLAGGVALASAGFAIGSQSGDGCASAARDGGRAADARDAHLGGRHGPGEELADALGVEVDKVEAALPDRP